MSLSPYAECKKSALLFVAQKQSELLTSMATSQSDTDLFKVALISYLSAPWGKDLPEMSRFSTDINRLFRVSISKRKELGVIALLFSASYLLGESSDEDLAALTLILTQLESKPGGPYTTNSTDITLLTNVFVYHALALLGIYLPNLDYYLQNNLDSQEWAKPELESPWLNLYLIGECLPNEQLKIINHAESLVQTNPPESSLERACQLLIFQDFRPKILEPFQNQKFSNAETISAALWAKVWHLAGQTNQPKPSDSIKNLAIGLVSKKINSLSSDLRESGLLAFAKLLTRPISLEIITLSADFGQALGRKLSDQLYARLGAANIFHWLALEIYETCQSKKESTDLGLANIYIRTATKYYEECAGSLEVDPSIVSLVLDAVDEAHAEGSALNTNLQTSLAESSRWLPTISRHCTERSFGHCLGPILIIEAAVSDKNIRLPLKNLLHHYTAVRQMCNDLHNWPEDFAQKRVTSVTKSLFLTSQAFPNINQFQAKKIFWLEGLDLVIKHAKQELAEARQLLKKIKWPVHSPTLLAASIAQLESALGAATQERTTIKSLIHQFD